MSTRYGDGNFVGGTLYQLSSLHTLTIPLDLDAAHSYSFRREKISLKKAGAPITRSSSSGWSTTTEMTLRWHLYTADVTEGSQGLVAYAVNSADAPVFVDDFKGFSAGPVEIVDGMLNVALVNDRDCTVDGVELHVESWTKRGVRIGERQMFEIKRSLKGGKTENVQLSLKSGIPEDAHATTVSSWYAPCGTGKKKRKKN